MFHTDKQYNDGINERDHLRELLGNLNAKLQSLSESESDVLSNYEQFMAQHVKRLTLLDAAIRDYDLYVKAKISADVQEYDEDGDLPFELLADKPHVVPLRQFGTSIEQINHSLFYCRKLANRTQSQQATAMNVSQSLVSQMESNVKCEYEVGTLREWFQSCGFSIESFAIGQGDGFNRVEGLTRLALNAVAIKAAFSDHVEQMLSIFFESLRLATSADVLTCSLSDSVNNQLCVIYTSGLKSPSELDSLVRQGEAPRRLLNSGPKFIGDITLDEDLKHSRFSKREGIKSVAVLPFSANGEKGIVFLSFRKLQLEIGNPYWEALRRFSHLLAYMFDGVRIHHAIGNVHTLARESACRLNLKAFVESLFNEITSTKEAGDFVTHGDSIRQLLDSTINQRFGDSIASCLLWLKKCDEDDSEALVFDVNDRGAVSRNVPKIDIGKMLGEQDRDFIVLKESVSSERDILKQLRYPSSEGIPSYALVVPFKLGGVTFVKGAVVIALHGQSPNAAERDRYVRVLFGVGQAIARTLEMCMVLKRRRESIARRNRNEKKTKSDLDNLLTSLVSETGHVPTSGTLEKIARLVGLLCDASIVDIWPVDWKTRQFDFEHSVHFTSEAFLSQHEFNSSSVKMALLPRDFGNSYRILENASHESLIVANAQKDSTVNPKTKELGLKTLIGVPIFGPETFRADGLMWVRFANELRGPKIMQIVDDLNAIAKFIHFVWNPAFYEVVSERTRGTLRVSQKSATSLNDDIRLASIDE
jgi:hypothetical protein